MKHSTLGQRRNQSKENSYDISIQTKKKVTTMLVEYKRVFRLLLAILFANFFVCAVKIFIGSVNGCSSLKADGFHSLADGMSNVIAIFGIIICSRPSDDKHPYGHKKFEVISCLFIGMMLGYLSFQVAATGIRSILKPNPISFSAFELAAVGFTIIVNFIVSHTEYRMGRKWDSPVLIADSIHTRSDIMISFGVLAGIIGVKFGLPYQVDGLISLFIAICIAHSSYEIIKPSIATLVDTTVVDVELIKEETMKFSEVKGVHKIRSHGAKNDIFIDMHILVGQYLSVNESHALSHEIENELQKTCGINTQVIIHIEPFQSVH